MNDLLTITKRCLQSIALAFVTAVLCLASDSNLPSQQSVDADLPANRFEYQERPKRGHFEPALLKYKLSPTDAKSGETVVLSITMQLDDNWHTFSLTQPEFGLKPTVISLDNLYGLESLKVAFQPDPEPDIEHPFEDIVAEVHRSQVTWTMPLKVLASASHARYGVSGSLSYQLCKKDSCLPPFSCPFRLGDFAGLQPTNKQSAPASPPRVTPVVPPSMFQRRPFGSLQEFFGTAMTLGSILILTPWMLSITPAVLGHFAKCCESVRYRPLFPSLSFYGGLIAFGFIFTAAVVALSGELNSPNFGPIANHSLLYVVLCVTYLAVIAHLLKVVQWQSSGPIVECAGAVLLSFAVSLAILPVTLPYSSILLIDGPSLSSAAGLFAFLSGIAASFFAVALLPSALKVISRQSDLQRALRVVCALWLLGCFANSVQVAAALMFPAASQATPIATWTVPIRTDLGITYLLDFDDATTVAAKQHQPLLVIFSGINDVNSRLMELQLTRPHNLVRIEKYVRAQLFIDSVPRIVDESERKRIVKRNSTLQSELCGDATTPHMVVMAPDGKTILATHAGLEQNEGDVAAFLDEGRMKWQANQFGQTSIHH